MQFVTLFSTLAIIGLSSAAPAALTSRNPKDDPLYLTFWENGCGVDGNANQVTYVFSEEGPSYPGDCVPVGWYNWQSAQILEDTATSYSIDLFSGEGCNNFILTVESNGCYTQPEGQIILSARANLK